MKIIRFNISKPLVIYGTKGDFYKNCIFFIGGSGCSPSDYHNHFYRSSTDYKANLLKLSKASAEKSKSTVRKMRQQAMSQLKKTKDVSKDTLKSVEKQVSNMPVQVLKYIVMSLSSFSTS